MMDSDVDWSLCVICQKFAFESLRCPKSGNASDRSGIRLEKISILRVLKKKTWTPPRFLHRGPKKAVEHDSDIHFDLT